MSEDMEQKFQTWLDEHPKSWWAVRPMDQPSFFFAAGVESQQARIAELEALTDDSKTRHLVVRGGGVTQPEGRNSLEVALERLAVNGCRYVAIHAPRTDDNPDERWLAVTAYHGTPERAFGATLAEAVSALDAKENGGGF